MELTTAQVLAWRLHRQALEPVGGGAVSDVACRVLALRGWPADLADLVISVRTGAGSSGALERALEKGEVIRSYAFRGGSYVFTPEIGAVLLAVRTVTRVWETKRWQQQGGFSLADWEPLRESIRAALGPRPMTREEVAAHLAGVPALKHLALPALGAGSDSLYKPLHWWGDICFGPEREGHTTFRLLGGVSGWPGLGDVDEAGRRAVALYLGSYGPATEANLLYWLTEGLGVPRRRLLGWVADLGDELTQVVVQGVDSWVLTADLDELTEAEPSDAVRLLPGFDPWVMCPGTADTRIIAPRRRAMASRGANLVLWGGVVCGTWRNRRAEVTVSWFDEAGPVPSEALESEVQRLAEIRERELKLALAAV